MNLHEKLIKIRQSIGKVEKSAEGYGYKYVPGSAIIPTIRQKMDELGVLLKIDTGYGVNNMNQYIRKFMKKTKSGESLVYVYESPAIFMFINADNPEETLGYHWFLSGEQSDPAQAFGTALTYGERYFFLKQFQIPTDNDDPDAKQKPSNSYKSKYDRAYDASRDERVISQAQAKRLRAILRSKDIPEKYFKANTSVKHFSKIKRKDYDTVCGNMVEAVQKKYAEDQSDIPDLVVDDFDENKGGE